MTANHTVMRRVGLGLFGLAVLVFFTRALVGAWNDTDGASIPSAAAFVGAGGMVVVMLALGCAAWVILLRGINRRAHTTGFLISQLAKYVPGGVFQAMGQVGFARTAGVATSVAVTAFAALAVTQAVAGAAVTSLLSLVWTEAATWVRLLLGAGVLSVVFLDRRWMVWAIRHVPRASEAHAEEVPTQARLVSASAAAALSVIGFGVAFAILLGSIEHVESYPLVVVAVVAAWTVGFVALPVPAGLGLRELVIAAILGGTYPANVLVSVSVYLRLTVLVVEGIAAGSAYFWRRVDPSLRGPQKV